MVMGKRELLRLLAIGTLIVVLSAGIAATKKHLQESWR